MTKGVAIQIAQQFDTFAEAHGMPLSYSLTLLKESAKVLDFQSHIEKVNGLAKKKFESLPQTISDTAKEEELKSINTELTTEVGAYLEEECDITFEPLDSEKITTEILDKNIDKEGVSKCRRALIILAKRGLIK